MHGRQRAETHTRTDLLKRRRIALRLNEGGDEVVNLALPFGKSHTAAVLRRKGELSTKILQSTFPHQRSNIRPTGRRHVCGRLTNIAIRGNEKVPAASSITFI